MTRKRSLLIGSAMALVIGVAGCAEQAELQTELAAKQAENAALSAELATLKGAAPATSSNSNIPTGAKPGECYARITVPATFKTVSEKVVDREASETVKVVPATYKTVKEKILVKEASEKLQVVPATYKTVKEKILVQPEQRRIVTVPATYKTVSEKIKVADAYTTWKRGNNAIAVGTNALGGTILGNRRAETGEIMCLVEVPAEYKTVSRRVVATPATTREEVIPAKYKTVTKRVVATPASTRKVAIPAEYGTVTKRVEATPASVNKTPIPATYKSVSKTVETAPAKTVWTTVLCDVNTTTDVVRRLQTALKAKGLYRGPIDGIVGSQTRAAIAAYQSGKGVKSDILTMDSARELGIV